MTITGHGADDHPGRLVQAGKIVLGREWITQSGRSTIGEALQREPSISVMPGGKVGLKGLPGHTQILVDGAAPVGALSPLQMDPALIDRVEIIPSASAESGPFGIAGTIHLFTRRARTVLPITLNAGLSAQAARPSGSLSATGGVKEGREQVFNFSAEVKDTLTQQRRESLWWQWLPFSAQQASQERGQVTNRTQLLSVNPSWSVTPNLENQFEVKGSLSRATVRETDQTQQWASLDHGLLQTWRPTVAQSDHTRRIASAGITAQWRHKHSGATTSLVSARWAIDRSETQFTSRSAWLASSAQTLTDRNSSTLNRRAELKGQINSTLDGGHKMQYGMSAMRTAGARQDTLVAAQPSATPPDDAAPPSQTVNQALSGWIQDEWKPADGLSLKWGWRLDQRRLVWRGSGFEAHQSAILSSPSISLAWDLGEDGDTVLTLGVARTFSPLGPEALSPHPERAGVWSCTAPNGCQGNDPAHPDRAGNPLLRHQRSWGLDVALEGQWAERSTWSVRAYRRWIDDLVVWQTQLENPPWSAEPRWVERPINAGQAVAAGLGASLDASLRDWASDSPDIALTASLDWNASRVSAVPGPYNRLEDQPPWSVRLGVTHKLHDHPLELRLSSVITPANWLRSTAEVLRHSSASHDLTLQALWSFQDKSRLIASVDHEAVNPSSLNQYGHDAAALMLSETKRGMSKWALRWEKTF